MAEWVALLVLVPAIVIPVVLLFGFAGCFSKPHFEPDPTIISATGSSLSSVLLDWNGFGAVDRFKIEVHAHPNNAPVPPVHEVMASPFDVPNLAPGLYRFRVRTVFTDGDESSWSSPVDGAPLTTGFDTAGDPGPPVDQPAQGFCVVQRIEPGRLNVAGGAVRIILRGPAVGAASIDRIYISQPALTGDPYDSAADVKAVFDVGSPPTMAPLFVEAMTELPLPVIEYGISDSQPLLIAFDFTPSFPTVIRFLPVPPTDAVAYFQPGAAEAGIPGGNRSPGYASANGICLITRIEVG